MSLHVENIGDRMIVLKGIGRLFYEDGLPIAISMSEARKRGWEVSILHVADELLKNGWPEKRVVATIESAMDDDIDRSMEGVSIAHVWAFCNTTYENQREMIFNYLFTNRKIAQAWLHNKITVP